MKITVIFFAAVFLTLTTCEWRVAEGGRLKEVLRPGLDLADGDDLIYRSTRQTWRTRKRSCRKWPLQDGNRAAAKQRNLQPRSLEFAVLANGRMHKEIIRQATRGHDAGLRRDGRVITATA